MAAYLLAQITVTDPDRYQDYRKEVPAVIERYGGRFLVRGGATTPLEGDLPHARLVILEFPDRAAAQRFYDSPEYQAILPIRLEASTGIVALVEGV
jgi:uncharacterized protein (DUF1330 family)